jgi:hypothetical protein
MKIWTLPNTHTAHLEPKGYLNNRIFKKKNRVAFRNLHKGVKSPLSVCNINRAYLLKKILFKCALLFL